jgi:hypothetical protein
MNLSTDASFAVIWAGLIAVPPFMIVAFFAMRRWWPQALSPIAWVSVIALTVFVASSVLGFRLTTNLANVACVVIGWSAYCFLAASLWRIPQIGLRVLALTASAVPICIGYMLSSVGLLLLVVAVAEYTDPPRHAEDMGAGLNCTVTSWGWAIGDTGYDVHLYKTWTAIRFVTREVVSIAVDEVNPGTGPKRASCADALAVYANHQ